MNLFAHFWALWCDWFILFFALFLLALVGGFVARKLALANRSYSEWMIPRAVLSLALALGLWFAWWNKSLFDDAFISFRYAKNLLDGHGLAFNVGERVEGYTNFLWTVLLAGLSFITRLEIPYVALFACLACFAGNLVVVWLIGRRLSAPEPGQVYFPLAVLWLALNHIFHSYGTSGLETMFASLLVNLAVYFYLTRAELSAAALAGFFLILATFTRPDHSLFYVFMALVIFWDYLGQLWRARRSGSRVKPILKKGLLAGAVYAAPFILYLGYLVWKWFYYGDIVPNTYYASSAMLTYWKQGMIYGGITLLFGYLCLLLPLFLWWLATGTDPHGRRFKCFAGLSVLLYPIYVTKIGGDKMAGRFFITLLPFLLLGVEQLVHRLARRGKRRPAWAAIVVVALVCATFHGLPWTTADSKRWKVADPSNLYSVHSLKPLSIGMRGKKANRIRWPSLLKTLLVDRGISPVLSAGGLGIVSYYSELPVIDGHGLTDRYIAHRLLGKRGRIGHEKNAPRAYLDYRQVRLMRGKHRVKNRAYTTIRINDRPLSSLSLYRYDTSLIQQISEKSPEIHFVRFPRYLTRNTPELINQTPKKVAMKLIEFDHYYFMLNRDPKRRRPFVKRFIRLWCFEKNRYPKGTKAGGAFKNAFVQPVLDRDFDIDGYQGDTVIASSKKGKGKVIFPLFIIQGDVIGFLIGGGNKPRAIQVRLVVDGKMVLHTTGSDSDKLKHVNWQVGKYKGKRARLVLIDESPRDRLIFDMFYEAYRKPAGEPSPVSESP